MTKFQVDLAGLIEGKSDEECVEVPVGLLRAFVANEGEMMTTQQVADAPGVSRPLVVKLIDGGQLPAHLVGTHRRVRAWDLARYRERRRQKSAEAMDESVALTKEMGLSPFNANI